MIRNAILSAAILSGPFLLAAAAAADSSSSADPVDHGRQVFALNCAPCHGRGPGDDGDEHLPGTAALQRKYQGAVPAALELRADLAPEVLEYFIRNGTGAMPPFRKSELTDADIAALHAYIQATAAQGDQR